MFNEVGLVGVGAMGQALLHRLLLAGVKVKAYDISEASLAVARQMGADIVDSPAAAARDVVAVHLFVRTDAEQIEATTGAGGILEGASPGMVLFLHSTVLPATTHRVAEAAEKRQVDVLDAPVTSIPRHVHAGEGVFLLGGDAKLVMRVRPYLKTLGKDIRYFGPLGSGNVAKIAKNQINAVERVAFSEVLAIVEASGIDVEEFLEMAVATDNGSMTSRWERAFAISNNHADPLPATNVLNKDIGLAADLARILGLNTPITNAAASTARVWVAGWEASKTRSGN